MECNKDEAGRAKGLAEEKMLKNDFEGARKIALKARNLFPELDNISQLISVCEVHCSAQKKIHGAEKDLYGILQVENIADEATIRKQYRKLALVLHPDKNKFPGAEAAFKLIGEYLNRPLRCQQCLKLFIAYDIGAQGAAPGSGFVHVQKVQPHVSQQEPVKQEKVKVNVQNNGQSHSHFAHQTSSTECNLLNIQKWKTLKLVVQEPIKRVERKGSKIPKVNVQYITRRLIK